MTIINHVGNETREIDDTDTKRETPEYFLKSLCVQNIKIELNNNFDVFELIHGARPTDIDLDEKPQAYKDLQAITSRLKLAISLLEEIEGCPQEVPEPFTAMIRKLQVFEANNV